MASPIPITIITGFLGSGKTTLILNLIPQLPKDYRLALIKNEFGDVAVDSQLATSQAISGVRELLNGCICCNLVGSLGDALEQLRVEQSPDRIVIETSGSAFPATLAMEVNRLANQNSHYSLDGVISVIDVENWKGYDDTSLTAKLQAKYTDLLVLNKWEHVSERAYEDCVDRILALELDVQTPREKSDKGWVNKDLLLGLDAKLASFEGKYGHDHEHANDHQSEVEVLSVTLTSSHPANGVNMEKLFDWLNSPPKDEVYRIKGIFYCLDAPAASTGEKAASPPIPGSPGRYILNWAFGRWTFTAVSAPASSEETATVSAATTPPDAPSGPLVQMTVIAACGELRRWEKRIEAGEFIAAVKEPDQAVLQVKKVS
ncbi:putative GTP-binding protein YjiA [Venturia nashicola]|uniref:Putative GTP-binding protein YjiA n=1 Tax=Venturia nashicola TaxID=86259 RepID=A0A4Z1PE98_9PEZI|nr:putative GTP-binding protein YjiA [Venturia nashicola]